jgi:hypothetical protein
MLKKALLASFCAVMLQGGNFSGCSQQNEQSQNRNRTQQGQVSESGPQANASGETPETEDKNKTTMRPFYEALDAALSKRGMKQEKVCDKSDSVSRRILEEYGALFVASDKVKIPPACIFTSETEVTQFQQETGPKATSLEGVKIELQAAALDDLILAREEARLAGLKITPRGEGAARRDFSDTLRFWDSRFQPALRYWRQKGRLTESEVERLRSLSVKEQVREVLELEKRGIYFSKDFSKSILYSVAAPGTSQHLSMLALDVEEYDDKRVRDILARHGWFQTVKSDLPHFTYLGVNESALPSLGLRSVKTGSQVFWIPNVESVNNN